jgi:hypothetical protein
VWVVVDTKWSPEDERPLAVCSSLDQAQGVAASLTDPDGRGGSAAVHEDPVELWEPEDGVPEWVALYSCVITEELGYRPGAMDEGRPPTRMPRVERHQQTYAANRAPEPKVQADGAPAGGGIYVYAGGYSSAEDAEAAARAAYEERGGEWPQ